MEPESVIRLTQAGTISLNIGEPSGLTVDGVNGHLWSVHNGPDRVYRWNLNGAIQDTLAFQGNDLEGIAYNPADQSLWVVEEQSREIIKLGIGGNVLQQQALNLTGEPNSGLEGICFDNAGNLFVLNEKNPGLFIELNADLSIKSQTTLDFADDFSGIAYDNQRNGFWIISDQDEKVFFWRKADGVVSETGLPFPKAEGIAFDSNADRLYIVSETSSEVAIFDISE